MRLHIVSAGLSGTTRDGQLPVDRSPGTKVSQPGLEIGLRLLNWILLVQPVPGDRQLKRQPRVL